MASKAPFSLLTALLVLLPFLAAATTVSYCDGKGDYTVEVKGVDIKPNPVVRGKTAKFTISATTGDDIKAGKLVIDVSYLGFNIHEETPELCAEVETSCPVLAGDFKLSHSTSLPIFTPPGTYTLKMNMVGETGQQLACITFDFSIGFWAEAVAES